MRYLLAIFFISQLFADYGQQDEELQTLHCTGVYRFYSEIAENFAYYLDNYGSGIDLKDEEAGILKFRRFRKPVAPDVDSALAAKWQHYRCTEIYDQLEKLHEQEAESVFVEENSQH